MIRLRTVVPADIPRIAEICKDIWGGMDYLPGKMATFLSDPRYCVHGAELDGQLVAIALCAFSDDGTVYYFGGRTDAAARNKGLSRLLARMQRECAVHRGATKACYTYSASNTTVDNQRVQAGLAISRSFPVARIVGEKDIEGLRVSVHSAGGETDELSFFRVSNDTEWRARLAKLTFENTDEVVISPSWRPFNLSQIGNLDKVLCFAYHLSSDSSKVKDFSMACHYESGGGAYAIFISRCKPVDVARRHLSFHLGEALSRGYLDVSLIFGDESVPALWTERSQGVYKNTAILYVERELEPRSLL